MAHQLKCPKCKVIIFNHPCCEARQVQLRFDEYTGRFYRQDKNGRWYRFHVIGNTGIAFDVAGLLIKMGCNVDFVSEEIGEEI